MKKTIYCYKEIENNKGFKFSNGNKYGYNIYAVSSNYSSITLLHNTIYNMYYFVYDYNDLNNNIELNKKKFYEHFCDLNELRDKKIKNLLKNIELL